MRMYSAVIAKWCQGRSHLPAERSLDTVVGAGSPVGRWVTITLRLEMEAIHFNNSYEI